jgi:hypothetical protein
MLGGSGAAGTAAPVIVNASVGLSPSAPAAATNFRPWTEHLKVAMAQAGDKAPSVVQSNVMHMGKSVVDNKEKFDLVDKESGIYRRKEDGAYFAERNGIYQPVVESGDGFRGAFDGLNESQTKYFKELQDDLRKAEDYFKTQGMTEEKIKENLATIKSDPEARKRKMDQIEKPQGSEATPDIKIPKPTPEEAEDGKTHERVAEQV